MKIKFQNRTGPIRRAVAEQPNHESHTKGTRRKIRSRAPRLKTKDGGEKSIRTVTAVTFDLPVRVHLRGQRISSAENEFGNFAMFEAQMPQMAAACDLFATTCRRSFVPEPNLDELMQDPMTIALMIADRVDHRALEAMLTRLLGRRAVSSDESAVQC